MNISKGSIGAIIGRDTIRNNKTKLWKNLNKSLLSSPKSTSVNFANQSIDNAMKRSDLKDRRIKRNFRFRFVKISFSYYLFCVM